jgi:hypothetical protein
VVYFTATRQDSNERQLAGLPDQIRDQLGDEVEDLLAAPFRDWESALRFLVGLAEAAPLLVVIDEAPRLLASQPGSGQRPATRRARGAAGARRGFTPATSVSLPTFRSGGGRVRVIPL